jgi:hypothetical protein
MNLLRISVSIYFCESSLFILKTKNDVVRNVRCEKSSDIMSDARLIATKAINRLDSRMLFERGGVASDSPLRRPYFLFVVQKVAVKTYKYRFRPLFCHNELSISHT